MRDIQCLIRIQKAERQTRIAEETHHLALEARSSQIVDLHFVVVVLGSEQHVLASTRGCPGAVRSSVSYQITAKVGFIDATWNSPEQNTRNPSTNSQTPHFQPN